MPVTELARGETTFHLVGTAHVSQRSVDEVRDVIARVAPDVVCVELDQGRHDALTRTDAFRDLDVVKVVREGRTLYLLARLALSAYQRRIGASLGVKPGAELLAAIEAARAAGIPVVLIDRDINITLKRTWRNLGLRRRVTLLASLLTGGGPEAKPDAELGARPDARPGASASPGDGAPTGRLVDAGTPITAEAIEELKEPVALSELLAELGRQVPEIKAPLIDERDHYMAAKLAGIGAGHRARDHDSPAELAGTAPRNVVAIVGAAHVPGMLARLASPAAPGALAEISALERVPPASLVWRALTWLVPMVFVAALVWGWRRSDTAGFVELMLAWILPTSIAAAGCTLLAGGSLLSVAAALVVSPIAAILPLLGTGRVVGVIEAWRRRPSVADCARLADDLQTLRGFWTNPVTRTLLIAVASGTGTAAGFWIGVGWVASRL